MPEKIHRGNDGYVSLHRKVDGKLDSLVSIPVADFGASFFHFLEYLEEDSFFSINAFYRAGWAPSKRFPGYMSAYREQSGLRWLTACWVDIDLYEAGLSFGQGVGFVVDLQDRGLLPPASFLVRSGRGLWVMWLLVDDTPEGGPVRAWIENIWAFKDIQKELAQRLANAGADFNALDASRIMRLPGTINSKSGTRVSYYEPDGGARSYTLEDLGKFLGLERWKLSREMKEAVEPKDPVKAKAGRKGQVARWNSQLKQLVMLGAMRGGFREGHREQAAWLLAETLHAMRWPLDRIKAEVEKLARDCRSADGVQAMPLDREEVEAILVGLTGKPKRIRFQEIANRLDITQEEADQLATFPCASRFKHLVELPALATRKQRLEARRQAIKDICKAEGCAPATRDMAQRLEDYGLGASWVTVASDYKALGLSEGKKIQQLKLL